MLGVCYLGTDVVYLHGNGSACYNIKARDAHNMNVYGPSLRLCSMAQRSVNPKHSLVLAVMFRFKPASQFVERCHGIVNCSLSMEDFISIFLL
jgi:hypothetical protein